MFLSSPMPILKWSSIRSIRLSKFLVLLISWIYIKVVIYSNRKTLWIAVTSCGPTDCILGHPILGSKSCKTICMEYVSFFVYNCPNKQWNYNKRYDQGKSLVIVNSSFVNFFVLLVALYIAPCNHVHQSCFWILILEQMASIPDDNSASTKYRCALFQNYLLLYCVIPDVLRIFVDGFFVC